MGSITWSPEIAEIYDKTHAAKFEPLVLGPIVDLLAELAQGGDTNFMPVVGRTKVLPELPADTRKLLAEAWPAD